MMTELHQSSTQSRPCLHYSTSACKTECFYRYRIDCGHILYTTEK